MRFGPHVPLGAKYIRNASLFRFKRKHFFELGVG